MTAITVITVANGQCLILWALAKVNDCEVPKSTVEVLTWPLVMPSLMNRGRYPGSPSLYTGRGGPPAVACAAEIWKE
jgi:hypothetical protein